MQDMSQNVATPLGSVIQQISLVSVVSPSFGSYYRDTLVTVVGHSESYSVIVVCWIVQSVRQLSPPVG